MNEKQNREMSFGMHKLSWLDHLIYSLRVSTIKKYCAQCRWKVVADVGCWYNAVFLRYIQNKYAPRKSIAYDLNLHKTELQKVSIECIEGDLNEPLQLTEPVDCIFATAILEHLEQPVSFLSECYKHLAPGGCLLLTTPSVWSQPVLEFLAYKLHVISEEEIRDHKEYFDKEKLLAYYEKAGFDLKNVHHEYFEIYMNNLVVAYKK